MFGLPRILAIYAIAIPLALFLGYSTSLFDLSDPSATGFAMVGLILFVLALPLFIRWHHTWLIVFWNAAFNVFFLPAQPHFWLLLAVLSFGISWLDGLLGQRRMIKAPELTKPLLFLAGVVAVTALIRGGVGIRSMGSASYGGKNYIYVLGPILGFFALSSVRVPLVKARRLVDLYFLSGTTFALSNLALLLGPSFYFLFLLLPSEYATTQAASEAGYSPEALTRIEGLAPACSAIVFFLLAHWGIRGVFDIRRPWRLLLFCAAIAASSFAGFRSVMGTFAVLLVFQFFCEGLWRTRFLAIMIGFGVCAAAAIAMFSDQLPLTAQRAISFLPVKVDPGVRADAENSTEWRLQMWSVLYPEIPKYLWVGKGYSIDPADLYFADEASKRGLVDNFEVFVVSGDYHSGFLSLIIPFGIWGVIVFLWFLGAGTKVLVQNYRYGDPYLRNINTFLLAFFLTQIILYFTVFGAFSGQMYLFTGALGLSVSLNGRVKKARKTAQKPLENAVKLIPESDLPAPEPVTA